MDRGRCFNLFDVNKEITLKKLNVNKCCWDRFSIKVEATTKAGYLNWFTSHPHHPRQDRSTLVSISPTFYEQLFQTKGFRAAFLNLHCRFKLFWRKEFGAKAARKMLVKLTSDHDTNHSFTKGNFAYNFENEPKSRPGKFAALVLVIDKHTDLVAAGSDANPFSGFYAFIGSSGTFPLTRQADSSILPGKLK